MMLVDNWTCSIQMNPLLDRYCPRLAEGRHRFLGIYLVLFFLLKITLLVLIPCCIDRNVRTDLLKASFPPDNRSNNFFKILVFLEKRPPYVSQAVLEPTV